MKLKYIVMAISIFLVISILVVGCQTKQQPATLKDLSIAIVATQMKVIEPPPPPAPPPPTPTRPPTPAPSPVPPAAKPGAPPAKPGAPPAKPEAPPAKPAAPPPGPPPTISLTLTFKIDNPNDVELKLQQINYSVSGSGLSIPVKMGQLFTIETKIPPKGSILREDTIEIVRAGPYAAMWELIKQVDRWSVNGVALIVQEGFAHPFAASK